ncbi:hypothetical protein LCGC14_0866410 [marine sediment metagenome]|uniref:DUF7352 domain-containing protein n=1 Tax=marine sediment metagenome TaxID=412755 RepID=A0A0F9SD24_9ZZZZ|nr:hypothetical protein [Candidatus Aminicenantes bacterium]
MRTIYKYPIPIEGAFEIELPTGAMILSFQSQNGVPCIWAMVDTGFVEEERSFRLFGTGHPIGNIPKGVSLHYIGTMQQSQIPPLVWHLFEEAKK